MLGAIASSESRGKQGPAQPPADAHDAVGLLASATLMATYEPSERGSEEQCLDIEIARLEQEQARLTDRVDLLRRICESHVFAGPGPQVRAPSEGASCLGLAAPVNV